MRVYVVCIGTSLLALIIPATLQLANKQYFKEFSFQLYSQCMDIEYSVTGKFSQGERHTFDYVYDFALKSQDQGDALISTLFSSLRTYFSDNEELKDPGLLFVNHLQKVYGLVCNFMKHSNKGELYEDECTSLALDLLNYLDSSDQVREEMQAGYIQYLVDFHATLHNWVEAAMTQQSQINMLRWSDEICIGTKNYPREPHRSRKEKLIRSAMQYFIKGHEYERAISMIKQLQDYHRYQSFNFPAVAALCNEESVLWNKIDESWRAYPNYFRVQFFGSGFEELGLRNKLFVYRGAAVESVRDFTGRLKAKYQQAHIIPKMEVPTPELESKHEQIISIVLLTLTPLEDRRSLLEELRDSQSVAVPELQDRSHIPRELYHTLSTEVRKQVENNHLFRVLECNRGVQKSTEKRPANEFKTLWVEKTYLFTEEAFPTNRRRIPVIWTKVKHITPLENAVATVRQKTLKNLPKTP